MAPSSKQADSESASSPDVKLDNVVTIAGLPIIMKAEIEDESDDEADTNDEWTDDESEKAADKETDKGEHERGDDHTQAAAFRRFPDYTNLIDPEEVEQLRIKTFLEEMDMPDYGEESSTGPLLSEKLAARLEAIKQECLTGKLWTRYRFLVGRAIQEAKVDKVVCLGPDAFLESLGSGLAEAEAWLYRVGFAFAVAEQVRAANGEGAAEVPIFFYHPEMGPGDVRLITALGGKAVSHSEAKERIDKHTLVYVESREPQDQWTLVLQSDPGVYIGPYLGDVLIRSGHLLFARFVRDDSKGKIAPTGDEIVAAGFDFLSRRREAAWPEVDIPGVEAKKPETMEYWQPENWGGPRARIYWLEGDGKQVLRDHSELLGAANEHAIWDVNAGGRDHMSEGELEELFEDWQADLEEESEVETEGEKES